MTMQVDNDDDDNDNGEDEDNDEDKDEDDADEVEEGTEEERTTEKPTSGGDDAGDGRLHMCELCSCWLRDAFGSRQANSLD